MKNEENFKSRILLRLDDGSVIVTAGKLYHGGTPGSVVRLPFEQAIDHGLAGEAQLLKLESYIARLASSHPSCFPEVDGQPTKKARTTSQLSSGEVVPAPAAPAPAPAASAGAGTVRQSDFVPKCMEVYQKLIPRIGSKAEQEIFLYRVPDTVPNYYSVIKRPMWLSKVKDKLQKGMYADAYGFYEDMKLIWENCKTFNGNTVGVGAIGAKAASVFERLWVESGLHRSKRAGAGVAASKHDAAEYTPQPSAKSQQQGGKKPQPQKARSGEVTSAAVGGRASPALSQERIMQIAEQMTELDGDQLQGLLPYLGNYYTISGEGEFELDWESMQTDMDVMVKVDTYLRRVFSAAPEPSQNPSVQLDRTSDSDASESEPDSD